MSRTPLFAANWKMNMIRSEAEAFFQDFINRPNLGQGHDVAVFPPYTTLPTVASLAGSTPVGYGAQDMHWEDKGAFTGAVSGPMLLDLGCQWVILGHSERREIFRETDSDIAAKLGAAHRHRLRPIVCIGETLDERKAGQAFDKVGRQVASILDAVDAGQAGQLVLAYEPIWAIGTGESASAGDAEEMGSFIRGLVGTRFGESVSASLRILYGGSVKPANIAEYMACPSVDGALVGGASMRPDSFHEIIQNGTTPS